MAEEKQLNISDDILVDLIKPDIDNAQLRQDDLRPEREKYYKLYRTQPYGNERDGWAKSVAPVVWNDIQWTLPTLMEVFMSDFFSLTGEDDDKAEQLRKWLKFQLFTKQDWERQLFNFLWTCLMNHYGVFKVCYREDFDSMNEKYESLDNNTMLGLLADPDFALTKYEEMQDDSGKTLGFRNVKGVRRKLNYAGPFVEALLPNEFGYTQDAVMTKFGGIEARLVYHEKIITLSDVKQKEMGGIYKAGSAAKCEELTQSASIDNNEEVQSSDEVRGMFSVKTQAPTGNEAAMQLKLRECYWKYDIDDDGVLENVIVDVASPLDGKNEMNVILRVVENPYGRAPFRVGQVHPEPGRIEGQPRPAVIENDQKIQTNLVRLVQDAAAISVYRNPITSDHTLFANLQQRKPFSPILGNPSAIGEVPVESPSNFILQAMEMMKQDVEIKSGKTRYGMGVDSKGSNDTATGVSIISNASAQRERLIARLLGNGPIKGVIRDMLFINALWPNMDEKEMLRLDLKINPQDLASEFDITVDIGVGSSEKHAMAVQYDQLIMFAMQGGMQLGIMTPQQVAKLIQKKYKILGQNLDSYITVPPPPKPDPSEGQADIKEYTQIDKLLPMLTPMERAQALQKIGIQADPQGGPTGTLSQKDILVAESKKADRKTKIMTDLIDRQHANADRKADMFKHISGLKGKQNEPAGPTEAGE